ncbi:2Fe-2S iron-sulfur cluster binding domain-containing protein [Aeromicrobium sp. SMF47]|uniref:2Fe-2S iron-sulfur cluster-binding protein n=1 Tax=Aeromicrobium TaxID=2040 RepID=UPI00129E65E7|nr:MULTISPECIES: 2Fe-2S iron-sulfur cluster-binding protein [Aeromicrobium]MRJ75141.1 2Fe-2S iron-sulfur cluster binding domain-containing protein [Aeromicrobium yanjiei]MRK02802.1 2Fe-2S iron-sulfur cluster binding domain-containing protein [Aeromicrobium sp. S22]
MAAVTYREPDGTPRAVEVEPGTSVMQAAVVHGVRGIVAECGGQLMCATCHVYVTNADGGVPELSEDERDMLELAAAPTDERSRLSCQLVIQATTTEVDVQIPEVQV